LYNGLEKRKSHQTSSPSLGVDDKNGKVNRKFVGRKEMESKTGLALGFVYSRSGCRAKVLPCKKSYRCKDTAPGCVEAKRKPAKMMRKSDVYAFLIETPCLCKWEASGGVKHFHV